MVMDVLGLKWSFIQFQKLGLGGEIPRVVLDSPKTECWVVHVTCVLFVLLL